MTKRYESLFFGRLHRVKIAGSVTYRFLLLSEERITPNESNVHQWYHIYGPSSGAPLGGIVGHAVDYQKRGDGRRAGIG